MRRSTVLSLPLQLVFPGWAYSWHDTVNSIANNVSQWKQNFKLVLLIVPR